MLTATQLPTQPMATAILVLLVILVMEMVTPTNALETCTKYYSGISTRNKICSDYCCGSYTYRYCCSTCSLSYEKKYRPTCSSTNWNKNTKDIADVTATGLSIAIIVGIVISVIIFLCIVGGIIACVVCGCCCWSQSRSRGTVHNQRTTMTTVTANSGSYPIQTQPYPASGGYAQPYPSANTYPMQMQVQATVPTTDPAYPPPAVGYAPPSYSGIYTTATAPPMNPVS